MDLEFTPHTNVIKIWYTVWFISLVLFYLIPVIPLLFFGQLLAGLITSVFILPWFILASGWVSRYYKTLKYYIKSNHIRVEGGV